MDSRRLRLPAVILMLGGLAASACTPIVEDGEVLELGSEDQLVGGAGDLTMAPRAGVEVRPGGTLLLRGASA